MKQWTRRTFCGAVCFSTALVAVSGCSGSAGNASANGNSSVGGAGNSVGGEGNSGGGTSTLGTGTSSCPAGHAGYSGHCYPIADNNWVRQEVPHGWASVAQSTDGRHIVAATTSALFVSNDSGASWMQRGTVQKQYRQVACSADGSRMVAVADGDHAYVSSDSGQTWTASGPVELWKSVAISSDGTKLFAAGWYLFTSDDGGATWVSLGQGSDWRLVAMTPDGSQLFAGGAKDSFYSLVTSTDFGQTWQDWGWLPTNPAKLVMTPDSSKMAV